MPELLEKIEKAIRDSEEKLTAELRVLTGRDDIEVHYDRSPLLGQPEPAPLPDDYWETAE